MNNTGETPAAFEMTVKRTKKQLAEDAIKRFLAEAGYTVMRATVEIDGVNKVNSDPRDYKHEMIVKFDGALES